MAQNAGRIAGHLVFFPAAAAYAALAVPLSVASLLHTGFPAGLAFPAGHAHELVFGFALAAVAGNQLGPTSPRTLGLLFALWAGARIAFLAAPASLAAGFLNGAFALALAARLVPRLLGSARKWRNRALPAALLVLCAGAVAMQAALRAGPAASHTVLSAALLALALLMLFMGGRIVGPAIAVALERHDGTRVPRVQPRHEGALVAAMAVAIAAFALGAVALAGSCALAAAAVAASRMARWRPWRLHGRPDLWRLLAGYAWLATGLAAMGGALLLAPRHFVAALHVVTIGAMGTLTLNVMALTWLRLARRDPARAPAVSWGTGLIALATAARIAADFAPHRVALLTAAAACWCAAYVLLLALFARIKPRPDAAPAAAAHTAAAGSHARHSRRS